MTTLLEGLAMTESRARAMSDALPVLRALRGAVVVIKYGGAAMTDGSLADEWAKDVVLLEHVGVRPVVVHGGGPALTRMLDRLGIETRFVDGHRVTTAETAEVAEMVLAGRINKDVVARLNRAGGRAVGLSGTDGAMIRVRRRVADGADLGFVGDVEGVDATVILDLLAHRYIPVISSTAAGPEGQPYNINADLVAGAIAGALGARALLFLSDVAGVLDGGQRIPELDPSQARRLVDSGVASSGMRPKLEAGLAALEAGVPHVHFLDGRRPHALLREFGDGDEGTHLRKNEPSEEDRT